MEFKQAVASVELLQEHIDQKRILKHSEIEVLKIIIHTQSMG